MKKHTKPRPTKIYRHYAGDGELLYIGRSINLPARLMQHEAGSHWFDNIATITIEHVDPSIDHGPVESLAIRRENPRYNLMSARTNGVCRVKLRMDMELRRRENLKKQRAEVKQIRKAHGQNAHSS